MMPQRKIVIINQAANYLTIGFANAFALKADQVTLITGSVHTQGEELSDLVRVHWINKWQESPASRKALSYLLAMLKMWWLLLTRYRHHEVFFVSVPPMGYLLNLILPNRFSMVIWDVYPDLFKITGMSERHWVYTIWSFLNKRSFRKAYKIFTIGEKMAELLYQYVDSQKVIILPIWSIFQTNQKVPKEANPFVSQHRLEKKFIIQYSGNIGLTHNVEVLIDLAVLLEEDKDIVVQIIGRGPRKKAMQAMVQKKSLHNCQFLPFQSDEMFPYSLSAADIGAVILDEKTSKGSAPSKSYNLMSYGIPSLYIAAADSQLNVYARKYQHAICFTRSQLGEAATAVRKLKSNRQAYAEMAKNAEKAAADFKRGNADRFVAKYFEHP